MPLGQKQSVGTLNLVVYRRPLHPELFEIYHDHKIAQPRFDAAIWITGCSHVLRFSAGDLTVAEVMAEAGDELPERGLVARFRCKGEKQHEYRHNQALRYMMNLQTDTMSEKLYAQTHEELTLSAAEHGLLVPFPQWRAGELAPFSYIDYQVTPQSLHVFAYHAFPDELTVIKTQSLFELQ